MSPWSIDEVLALLDEARAQRDIARRGLDQVAQSGDEIAEMAWEFIQTRDLASLTNYGNNVASIARAALKESDPRPHATRHDATVNLDAADELPGSDDAREDHQPQEEE